jgi:hypothetical protein
MDKIPPLTVKQAWITNSYMDIPPEWKTFFPDDAFIARGTGGENKSLPDERRIAIHYEGVDGPVKVLLELRDSGKFRPSDRGAIRRFYAATGAREGDKIAIAKAGPRVYRATLDK